MARQYLERRGLRLIEKNYACRSGELDLIMAAADCVAVVEVRARAPGSQIPALLTVDRIKQGKIIRATEMWLAANEQYADHTIRFDIIAIDGGLSGHTELQWIRDAFRVE